MSIWKLGGLAVAAVLSSGLLIGQASAMPAANGLATVAGKVGNGTQEVRWVGGWRGVGWRGAGWGLGWRGGWAGGRWGYGRWGYGRGLYAYGGPGWRMGWRRPLYAYGGPGYGGWGWRRPLLAAAAVGTAVGVASTLWDSNWYGNNTWDTYGDGGYGGYGNPYVAGGPYVGGGPFYAFAAGGAWNGGWGRPGIGWRRWGW
jgi:hypothetical protein